MLPTCGEQLKKHRLGVDSCFDFKEVHIVGDKIRSPTQEALADEIATFANSSEGVLHLGVNDDWELIGIPEEHMEAMEEVILKDCQQSIRLPLAPVIEEMTGAGF